jgi:transcriptional regulator with XRE-family HTH domain
MCVALFAPESGAYMGKQLRTSRHKALMAALTTARERAGLSQRELAKRLGRAHSFVGKIESGERQLNVLEFCDYADVLGANAAELLGTVVRGKNV